MANTKSQIEVKTKKIAENAKTETKIVDMQRNSLEEQPQNNETATNMTIQQLKDKSARMYLLQKKHTELCEKRAMLDNFAISHERENVIATVVDCNNLKFSSNSPKTIAKLLEFWKSEFETAICEVERELKIEFGIYDLKLVNAA
ncbi:MAG: hypothetical protein LBB41_02315 [Prevotellaceae bacterium]|jgi:hypothetical protein|nr:hypothetical protein [Prevotellaceae bacterium]